jgi:DNA repair protein RecN (Recombination protein N)
LQELTEARLQVGEDTQLEEKIQVLQNSEKIYDNLAASYEAASDSEYSILSSLKGIAQMIDETSSFSQELKDLSTRINEIYYDFEDVCSSIRSSRDNTVFSPGELDEAINRFELINQLKNKHGKSIEELLEYQEELSEKLSLLESIDEVKNSLKAELSRCKEELVAAAENLSNLRMAAAKELESKISYELTQLNFTNAEFSIEFKPCETITHTGMDNVEFMISANRGEALKPLSKIASGGEMSRIMLAFKKIIGDYDQIPTMIFDEIDSGISGITASVVGGKLREIAANHQIICITHLPQIAAYGDYNYKIAKSSDDAMTYTQVTQLSDEEKVHEIARLLGGSNITETTLKSARELIDASVS